MDKRIERALNYPACVKPLHKAGWRENGTSIRSFTGEFVEYGYQEPFSNRWNQEIIMSDVPSQPEPEPVTPEPPAEPQPEDAPADAPG